MTCEVVGGIRNLHTMKRGSIYATAGLAIAAVVLYSMFGPKDSTAPSSPDTVVSPASDAGGSPFEERTSTPVALQGTPRQITLPELLSDPRALDPKPLKLNFGVAPFKRQKDGTIHKTDVMLGARDLNKPDHETEEDLQILHTVIGSYHDIFLQNPVAGENREVVDALTGKNLHRLVFINPTSSALSAGRELLDRWGTPYRFHPISGSHMEISSAGVDGLFGTRDDVTLQDPAVIGDRGAGS